MLDRDWYNRNSAWITAVTLLGISIPSTWYMSRLEGFHNGYQQRQTEQIQQKADSDLRSKCSVIPDVDIAITCAESTIEAAAENSHNARDLEAQWQSATWAKLMLIVTGVLGTFTTILSYFGVVLLRSTLREAKDTNIAAIESINQAKLATEAAWAGVKVSRDVADAQLRPYLDVSDFQIDFASRRGSVKVKFTGQIPVDSLNVHITDVTRTNHDEVYYPFFHNGYCNRIMPDTIARTIDLRFSSGFNEEFVFSEILSRRQRVTLEVLFIHRDSISSKNDIGIYSDSIPPLACRILRCQFAGERLLGPTKLELVYTDEMDRYSVSQYNHRVEKKRKEETEKEKGLAILTIH